MKINLKKAYLPLYNSSARLMSDLNSGGFEASLEWHFQPDEGYPLPIISVAGYGTLTLFFDKWIYRMLITKSKALGCHFKTLASEYSLTVYGHDDPTVHICDNNDCIDDLAFAISGSGEAFFNIEISGSGTVDGMAYKKLLASIERSMCLNEIV